MKPSEWRRSAVGQYLRHLPRIKHLRGSWLHRTFGDRLLAPELWNWNRQAIARGLAEGALISVIPIPMQSLAAATIAFFTRSNIPVAMAACWISNPFTTPILIYLQLEIGSFLIGRPSPFAELRHHTLWEMTGSLPLPWGIGVAVVGTLLAILCYFLGLGGFDVLQSMITAHRRHRQQKRPPDDR